MTATRHIASTRTDNQYKLRRFVDEIIKAPRLATTEEVEGFCKLAGIRTAGFICLEVQEEFWQYYQATLSCNLGKWEIYPAGLKLTKI